MKYSNKYINKISIISLYILLSVYICFPVTALAARESGAKTSVTAQIPAAAYIRLFGYTSPYSTVMAEGIRVYAQTSTDRIGYFLFEDLPLSKEAKEVCLTTIDAEKRAGFPLCIAIPDNIEFSREIGPLLLSPTVSLSNEYIYQKENGSLSGRTIPDADVKIAFFEAPTNNTLASYISKEIARFLFPSAEAADLPVILTHTDDKGRYSVNVPSNKAVFYRVYAKSYYNDSPTFKSRTLGYEVGSIIEYWFKYIVPWILFFLIIVTLCIIGIYFEWKTKKVRKLMIKMDEKVLQPARIKWHLLVSRLWNKG